MEYSLPSHRPRIGWARMRQVRRLLLYSLLALASFGLTSGVALYWRNGTSSPSADGLIARAEAAQASPAAGDVIRLVEHSYTNRSADPLIDPYHVDAVHATPSDTYTTTLHRMGENGTIVESDVRQTDRAGVLLQQDYTLGQRQYTYLADQHVMWIADFDHVATFTWPLDARQLAGTLGLQTAGTEKGTNGAVVDVLKHQVRQSDGTTTELLWGVRDSDGQLAFQRMYRVLADGSRTLLTETDVTDYELNAPAQVGDFTPPPQREPILDFTKGAAGTAFSIPAEREVTASEARVDANFRFRSIPKTVEQVQHIYRGSQAPLSWDALSVDQRGLQYATGVSHAYRTVGAVPGAPFLAVQGSVDEMSAIMKSTPPLWSSSRDVAVDTASGRADVWIGPLRDGDGAIAVARFADSIVVLGATGLTEGSLLELVQGLK